MSIREIMGMQKSVYLPTKKTTKKRRYVVTRLCKDTLEGPAAEARSYTRWMEREAGMLRPAR